MKFIHPSFHFWVCKFRLFVVRHSIFHNRSEVLAHNKRDQSYQNSWILRVTPQVSCRTLGLAFVKSTKESYRIGEHLIRLLLFVKFIHEYAHYEWNPWKSELKEHLSTPNTKFDKALSLFGITVLNTQHGRQRCVQLFYTQMQKTGGLQSRSA